MKRISIHIALLLLFTANAGAKSISESEASAYARKFFNSASVTLSYTGYTTQGEASYYVYDNPAGGWVMIAADDVAEPVLGYNNSGKFVSKGMPLNVSARLGMFSEEIHSARIKGLKQSSAAKLKWETVGLSTKAGSEVYLETAEWNQGSGDTNDYNMYCPKVTGESARAVTGCVATSMAIVLRYNKWPQTGKGTLSNYSFTIGSGTKEGQKYSVSGYSIDGKKYDYTKMPTKGSGSWTQSQWQAIADLMHDCGVMVEMKYSCDGSAAYSSAIIPALAAHMKYSAGAREIERSGYSQVDWFKIIKAELDADRPIIYGGQSEEEGGHQFVLDGYNSNGKVHINWGWGGYDNGWYALNTIGEFNIWDSAIVGLAKDEAGTDKQNSETLFIKYKSGTDTFSGLELSKGEIKYGSTFNLKVGWLWNVTNTDAKSNDYYIKLCLVGKDGEIKYDLTPVDTITIENSHLQAYTLDSLSLEQEPEVGDHISLYQRLNDGNWVIISCTTDFITDHYKDEGISYAQNCIGVVNFPILYVKDSYKAGEVFYFNNLIAGQKPIFSTSWFFDGKANATGCQELTAGQHTVSVKVTFNDSTTATISQKITVN